MVRRFSLLLVVALLLSASSSLSLSQSAPKSDAAPADHVAALEKRVEALEAQLAEANKRLATLEAKKDDLTRAVAAMWMAQSQGAPKGSKPYEFNGLTFYSIQTAAASNPAPKP